MLFKEMATQRQSCRRFLPQLVERSKLENIIRSAGLAPSACNSQPWKFVVVDDQSIIEKMPTLFQADGFNQFCNDVKAYIVICETKATLINTDENTQRYAQIDIGLTTANITYAALEENLGTCIMGSFVSNELKSLLEIPSDTIIRLVIAVGYPASDVIRQKQRKSIEEICSFNKW